MSLGKKSRNPKTSRHRSGQAVVRINGKDIYLGKFGSVAAKKKYAAVIREWKSSALTDTYSHKEGMAPLLAALVTDYLAHLKAYHPRAGNSEYKQPKLALRYLSDYLDMPADEFRPTHLRTVRLAMVNTVGARGETHSRQYVKKMIGRILRMFKWAAGYDLMSILVHDQLKAVEAIKRHRPVEGQIVAREVPTKEKAVKEKRVALTLPHLTPVLQDMVRLQLFTGMRPGEVVRLQISDIHQDINEDIDEELRKHIENEEEGVWAAFFADHKSQWRADRDGEKPRVIYFGPQAQEVLAKYLDRDPNKPIFSPREAMQQKWEAGRIARKTPLSCGNRAGTNRKKKPQKRAGEKYTTQSYGRAIRVACSKAFPIPDGLDKKQTKKFQLENWWSPNQLRHRQGTNARAEADLDAAQALLGHASKRSTEIYAKRVSEKGVNIALKIG